MPARSPNRCRRAFTLVEMLVAMVLTLILVAAIAEFYAFVGETVKDGRAMIELNGSLRTAVQRLKQDLDLLTLPVVPWTDDAGAFGYFEIYEGINNTSGRCAASDADVNGNLVLDANDTADLDNDGTPDWSEPGVTNLLGDGDDFIAMTIRASGEPFTGRYEVLVSTPNGLTTQPVIGRALHAEVIWWVGFTDTNNNRQWDLDEPRQIYRRQLLIRPDLPEIGSGFPDYASALTYLMNSWQTYDISASVRLEPNLTPPYRIRCNSLADLSRREYRFAHLGTTFPFPQVLYPTPALGLNHPLGSGSLSAASPNVQPNMQNTGNNYSYVLQNVTNGMPGEDIVLTNVLAFDVKVYDPYAQLRADVALGNISTAINALAPGDPGYPTAVTNGNPVVGVGAFVDLGYGESMGYSAPPANVAALFGNSYFAFQSPVYYTSALYLGRLGRTYDTWSLSYERDGLNQDGDNQSGNPLIDEGTNGLDDDGINGVDDVGERETAPPFAKPLRGVQVTIRIYEPGTRQMRQATVKADFILE